MQILMKSTRRGSEDGFGMREYEAGRQYDLADTLARHFIRSGWAEPVFPPANEVAENIVRAMVGARLSAAQIVMPVPNPKADGPRVSAILREHEGVEA